MKKRTKKPVHLNSTVHNMRPCTVYQRTSGYLPGTHAIGYEKCRASPGDIVEWSDSAENRHIGRVLGTVDAPAQGDQPAVKGFLFVMLLSSGMTHTYPVWVDPKDVTSCRECTQTAFLAFFLGPMGDMAVEDIVRASKYGTLSDRYIENLPGHICRVCGAFECPDHH